MLNMGAIVACGKQQCGQQQGQHSLSTVSLDDMSAVLARQHAHHAQHERSMLLCSHFIILDSQLAAYTSLCCCWPEPLT
jgi:hypothetical protein